MKLSHVNARGIFSFAYLDYTNSSSRVTDLCLLIGGGLLRKGILAITCPARAPHVDETADRHLRTEASLPLLVAPDEGAHDVHGDYAGLSKVHVEVNQFCNLPGVFGHRVKAEPLEAFAYTSRRTKMWVAVFAIMPDSS